MIHQLDQTFDASTAIEEVVDNFSDRDWSNLRSFFSRRVYWNPELAEELMQATLVELLMHPKKKWPVQTTYRTIFFVRAKDVVARHLGRESKHLELLKNAASNGRLETGDESPDHAEEIERIDLSRISYERLASGVGKEILWQRHVEGETLAAIAEMFRVPLSRIHTELPRYKRHLKYLLDVEKGLQTRPIIRDIRVWMRMFTDSKTAETAIEQMPFVMEQIEELFNHLAGECRKTSEIFAGAFSGEDASLDKLHVLTDLHVNFFRSLHGKRPLHQHFEEHFPKADGLIVGTINSAWGCKWGVAGSRIVYAKDGTPYQFLCFKGHEEGQTRFTPYLIREVIEP